MGASLAKTKRRILSIEGTQKTTKAMELISMVKVKKFSDARNRSSSFSNEYQTLMSVMFLNDKSKTPSHYGKENEGNLPTLYLVISSNLGLCGSYNSALFKYADSLLKENDVVAPFGKKAIHHYEKGPYKTIMDYSSLNLELDMEKIIEICKDIKNRFNQCEFKKIVIVYTHYINSITFAPAQFTLLPVIPDEGTRWPNEEYCPPQFDESPRVMMHQFLNGYLSAMLYSKLLESQLSEQSSRRTAMDNANDNADELLKKLSIEYNKARQSAITQEITEVVGGANAN